MNTNEPPVQESITEHGESADPPVKGFMGAVHQTENWALTALFLVMMFLPLSDVFSRIAHVNFFSDSLVLVQNLVLLVMMLGGAIAAREGKLLTISSASALLHGKTKQNVHLWTSAFAGAITLYLVAASFQLVSVDYSSGDMAAAGIPRWVLESCLPLGFLAILLRILWRASDDAKSRLLAFLLATLMGLGGYLIHTPSDPLTWAILGILIVSVFFGSPIFIALGGAALIMIWNTDTPISSIPVETARMVVSPTIPTIPLFTLTGYFLAEGGASERLLRVFQSLFGSVKGGPAIVTCLCCAFFTALTGGSGVTILALGGLLMPILLAEKYKDRHALGLLTSAGSLGMLFPPSIPVILYGVVSHTPIDKLFLGGFLPGCLLVGMTIWWGVSKGSKEQAARHPFHWEEAVKAAWVAKWELLLPVLIFLFLFVIKSTLVESAALTALYAFFIEMFVYKGLDFKNKLPHAIVECGILVGGVLLILGVSMGFTNFMVDAQIPDRMAAWVTSTIHSKWLFLLMINLLLILVGGLLEIYAAIAVVVPLLLPLGAAYGIDPIHLGIIFLANMELGFLCPPLGLNLFLSSYRFKKPMTEVYLAALPMYAILWLVVLVITYCEPITTWLPRLFK
jgi:tripartite ATP-independent transporter DctM subunit